MTDSIQHAGLVPYRNYQVLRIPPADSPEPWAWERINAPSWSLALSEGSGNANRILFVVGGHPTCFFVSPSQRTCERRSIGAQILFFDNIVLCDDERHHTRRPILSRVSDEAEPASSLAICSPFCHDTKVVTVDQDWLAARGSARRCRHQIRKSAVYLTLSLLICAKLSFGGHEFVTDQNGPEFVLADSSEQDFLQTSVRIEAPGAVLLNERDRERPVLGADIQGHRSVGVPTQTVHLLVFLDEHFAVEPILGLIARGGELRRPAQDVCDDLTIVALHGLEKCVAGLRGRRKRCPSRLLSKPLASAAKRQHHKDRQRERRRSDAFR